jgi:predicted negative regulator of RcsB-dependent stress response
MDTYKTEEEQLESLKRWMRDNGRHVVIGLLAVAVVVFGGWSWQQRQAHQREGASVEYQNLLQAMRAVENNASKETIATAHHLADTLKSQYGATTYAQFAALFKAKLAVQQEDLAQAETELRWVLAQKPSVDVKALAQLRLARVLHAKGDDDGALALLDETGAGNFAAAYATLKGDVALKRGDSDGARAAYERAQELERKMTTPINDPLLEMKLRDLQAGEGKPQEAS